jgi:diadenosine tetraphosphate (Ap4A) HIT family hydrolase
VDDCREGKHPRFVHEFAHSYLTVGEHQFFEGYCVLLLKDHVRDLHEIPEPTRTELFGELMQATEAIARAYEPWKMNHASYGNAQPHVHWHIFPRYEGDPDLKNTPWTNQDRFNEFATTPETAARVRERLLPFLQL